MPYDANKQRHATHRSDRNNKTTTNQAQAVTSGLTSVSPRSEGCVKKSDSNPPSPLIRRRLASLVPCSSAKDAS
jgi:hypothetical protein